MTARSTRLRPQPILVTGMPRSGTTWTARLLATAVGTSLPGREPMNPRGRQFGLGGTLDRWTRLEAPSPRQRRALSWTYAAVHPAAYSRYGRRQLTALRPSARVVVKDPFAMLSLPAVVDTTGARPVIVFRHPAACLASYRRMGWSANLEELRLALDGHLDALGRQGLDPDLVRGRVVDEAESLALSWAMMHAIVLDDLEKSDLTDALVVSHEQLAGGGEAAVTALFDELGLDVTRATLQDVRPTDTAAPPGDGGALHVFDRDPATVAASWRKHVSDSDLAAVESTAGPVLARLRDRAVDVRGDEEDLDS